MSLETNWMFATQQKWYGKTDPRVVRNNQGARWTVEERNKLVTAWRMGQTVCQIADAHGRTPTGICSKLEELLGGSYDKWWANPAMQLPKRAIDKLEKQPSSDNIEAQITAKRQQLTRLEAMASQVKDEILALQAKLDEPLPVAFIGDPYADQHSQPSDAE